MTDGSNHVNPGPTLAMLRAMTHEATGLMPILIELTDGNGDTYRVPAGHIAFVSDGTNLALVISENGIA